MSLKSLPSTTTSKIKMAAKTLFAARGYEGVTVKKIGHKSRTNPALINYHFGGKQNLYNSILEEFTQNSRDDAKKILRSPRNREDFLESLNHYIYYLIKKYLDDPELHIILNRESEKTLHKTKLSVFENQILEVFFVLEEFYGTAKKMKVLRSEINPRLITLMLFSTLGMLCQRNGLHEKFIKVSLNDQKDFQNIGKTLLCLYGENLVVD